PPRVAATSALLLRFLPRCCGFRSPPCRVVGNSHWSRRLSQLLTPFRVVRHDAAPVGTPSMLRSELCPVSRSTASTTIASCSPLRRHPLGRGLRKTVFSIGFRTRGSLAVRPCRRSQKRFCRGGANED